MASFILIASRRITLGILSSLLNVLTNLGVVVWDLGLTLFNLLAPLRPANRVVPEGHPGAGGRWPEYIAPKEGDSRSACPALNAMANHGRVQCPSARDSHNPALPRQAFSLGQDVTYPSVR